MRTNYVLIDFENVQPTSVEQLDHDHFKVFLFLGAHQGKLPFELVASMQRLGGRGEYVKISRHGSDALDFHIAYYLGQFVAKDPAAYFHIISKDTGFDPLIQHLRAKKIFISRAIAISEIPLVKVSNSKSSAERDRADPGLASAAESRKTKNGQNTRQHDRRALSETDIR